MEIEKQVTCFPAERKNLVLPFYITKKQKVKLKKRYKLHSVTCILSLRIFLIRFLRIILYKLKIMSPYFLLRPFRYSEQKKKIFYNRVKQQGCDLVLCEYIWYSDLLKYVFNDKKIVTIVETHDIQSRFSESAKRNCCGAKFYVSEAEEIAILNKFDLVLAISRGDEEYFRKNLSTQIAYLPLILSNEVKRTFKKDLNDCWFKIGFIGSSAPFNVDAVKWFLHEVIEKYKLPNDMEFNIYGKVCNCIDRKAMPKNTKLRGLIKDIAAVYEQNLIMVNPTFQSGGIKTKNIESLLYHTPVITTTIGSYGMESAANCGCMFIADDPQSFIDILFKLYKRAQLLDNMDSKCRCFMENNFNSTLYDHYLTTVLDVVAEKS